MTENTCEHEWDDSEDIDDFLDLVDLTPQFVQIKVRCCKCGKIGLTSLRQNGAQFSGMQYTYRSKSESRKKQEYSETRFEYNPLKGLVISCFP